ncbi:unnamed protein product, partial [Effrenium voratum]
QAAATAAMTPEDRAWELLLAIAGAHAQGGAGRSDLRRLAAEAKRLLAASPIEAASEPDQKARAAGLWRALVALWSFLSLVMSVLHDIVTVLVAAAMGQQKPPPEEVEQSDRPQVPDRPADRGKLRRPKAKSQKGRAVPGIQAGVADEEEEEEEEESSQSCCVS